MESRTCTKCGETRPLDAYYFEKGKPRASCKECHKGGIYAKREADPDAAREYLREWREKNPGKHAEYERRRRARDGEKINERRREQRAEDPGSARAAQRATRAKRPEHYLTQQRKWYDANREKMTEWKREYRKANSEKHREWDRVKRERHGERIKEYMRQYYLDHPEVYEINRAKRRARKALVEHQPYTRKEIYNRDGGECRICHKGLDFGPGKFQIDHIVPISLGGPDTPANVQLTCGPCNRAKWANLEGQIYLPV